jgi:predicted  nucleic acid-binding Zn-ribbon protein
MVEGLRRVPDGRILLAEMGEARRKAQKELAALREQPAHGPTQRAADAVHEMVEKLSANYHELEKAIADRVQLSRDAMNAWQDETRSLMRELRRATASVSA